MLATAPRMAFEPPHDTVVDPRARRLLPHRAVGASAERSPRRQLGAQALGQRGRPGDVLAPAPLAAVRVREAIVRRNHDIERAEAAPRSATPPPGVVLVHIEWARSRDPGQRITLVAKDTVEITGVGSTRPEARPGTAPALALGLGGLIYTVPLPAEATAEEAAHRLARRLEQHYEVRLLEVGRARALVRLVRPISLR